MVDENDFLWGKNSESFEKKKTFIPPKRKLLTVIRAPGCA
jgi:hypothetical protein